MGEPRKVLVASFDVVPDVTGASTRLTEIIRGLTPVFNVDALTSKTESHSHIERYYGARLMRVPMLRRDLSIRAQTFERAVRRQLESDEYELVHVADPFGGYPVCQRRGQAGHKVIYDAQTLPSLQIQITHPELTSELRFMTRLRRIERHCLLAADVVLAGSLALQAHLLSLGVPAHRVRLVPPPVDLTRFFEPSAAPPFPPGELRLAYLGGCTAWEGLEAVLAALRILLDRGTAARLVVAGELAGSARKLLRTLLTALRLGDAVDLLGSVPHEKIPELLESCHICLAPFAPPKSIGPVALGTLKFVEYLAAGRPVVAADTPLHRELAGPAGGVLFFTPADSVELAAKLQTLARDPGLRQQLGGMARSRARLSYDAGLCRKAVLRAYYDLLDPSVVVTADAYAVPDRTGAHEGEAPTASQAGLALDPAPAQRDATPVGGDSATHVSRVGPVGDEPTPQAPNPETALVPVIGLPEVKPRSAPPAGPSAAEVTPRPSAAPEEQAPRPTAQPPAATTSDASPSKTDQDNDWFSSHLPP